jgi:hypothetical protein
MRVPDIAMTMSTTDAGCDSIAFQIVSRTGRTDMTLEETDYYFAITGRTRVSGHSTTYIFLSGQVFKQPWSWRMH